MARKRTLPKKHCGPAASSGVAEPAARAYGLMAQFGMNVSADQVRKGLPAKAARDLAQSLNVDRDELVAILGISIRTFQRIEETKERLGPSASDRLARIERIRNLAIHVLGSAESAARWLTSKSRLLDGEVPLQMLDTDIGAQLVQQELRQIEFGMPA